MRSAFLILVCFFSSCSLAGQYHVCTDANGKKSFQDKPCGGGAKSETQTYDDGLSGVALGGGWSFYRQGEFTGGDGFCALKSRSFDVPYDYGKAGVVFSVFKDAGEYLVALVSVKYGVGNADSFDPRYPPVASVGGSGEVKFDRMDGSVAIMSPEDSAAFISGLDRDGVVRLKVRLWPADVIERLEVSPGRVSGSLTRLDGC